MKNHLSNFPKTLKTLKKIVLIVSFFFFFFSFGKLNFVWAQGTFGCRWIPGITKVCQVDPDENNCESGHVPNRDFCDGLSGTNEQECTNPAPSCIEAPPCGDTCDPYCTCPEGEECRQSGNIGVYTCQSVEEEETITLLKPEECCNCLRIDPHCTAEEAQTNPLDCCLECEEGSGGIQTALGCFPTQPKQIINWILKYSIMFAGGIGFLLMLWASIQIMTSAGDPEKLKNGQQLLTSAITGILIIVFALFLLKFIGWDILRLPGWGPPPGPKTPSEIPEWKY